LGALAFLLPLTLGMGVAHRAGHASYLVGAFVLPLSVAAVLTIAGMAITRCEGAIMRPLFAEAVTLILGLPLGLIAGALAGDFFAGAVIGGAAFGALGVNLGARELEPDYSEGWAASGVATLAFAAMWIVLLEIMGYLTQHWAVHSAVGFLDSWAGGLVHLLR
ncbi:MAG: hypothetical protein ACJ72W_08930, partial [Actinoallomurus sp.]